MSDEQVRRAVLEALLEVAPDVDASTLDPASAFRDQFDFDSMDYLNFVIALHQRLGVDIPERDYAQLNGVDAAVSYLQGHVVASTDSR
jgi:acyl carrier protein